MTFEPGFEKVVSNYRKRIGEMQTQIECKLPITEEGTAEKILSTIVKVGTINTSIAQNMIAFDGCAMIQVIYLNDNKEYKTCDYSLEFKDKFVSNEETIPQEVIPCCEVIDTRAIIDGNSIKVIAVLNISFDGICADKIKALTSASGESIFVKYEDIKFANFVGVAEEKFDVTNDIEIVDAVERVLTVCPTTYIDRIESYQDYIKVIGGVCVNITYITRGENSTIRTYDNRFDFIQEIALSGITGDSIVMGKIFTNYQNLGITTTLDQDKSIVNLVVPIDFRGYGYNLRNIQIVSDIYSTENFVNINTESFTNLTNFESKTFVEQISGSLPLEDNDLFIDEILGNTNCSVVVANSRLSGEYLTVDGVVSCDVIYRNIEFGAVVSKTIQIPYSVDLKVGDWGNGIYCVDAAMTNHSIKVRRGTEIEFSGAVSLYLTLSNLGKEACIESVNLSDEKIICDSNLTIYIAKDGDTIWDIAKSLSVSEDSIIEQNPELSLPITAGDRIVVYKQSIAKIN